jgi:mono/diheme cytochrome c family protein
MPVTLEVLKRGKERYEITCSACHGYSGYGDGMVAQRGFKRPPSFHTDQLRQAPASHYFDAMTNGFGVMPSYSKQITAEDRWKIVAYIRALQLSQNANINDVPPAEVPKMEAGGE